MTISDLISEMCRSHLSSSARRVIWLICKSWLSTPVKTKWSPQPRGLITIQAIIESYLQQDSKQMLFSIEFGNKRIVKLQPLCLRSSEISTLCIEMIQVQLQSEEFSLILASFKNL